jgi:hypothetical protein
LYNRYHYLTQKEFLYCQDLDDKLRASESGGCHDGN